MLKRPAGSPPREQAAPAADRALTADIRLDGVSKRFGDFWALRSTSLTVQRGAFFSLLGASGSGKTTTLRIIGGFEEPTTGSVFLQGRNVTSAAPYERNVNTVFQDYALFPHMTVEANVGYGLRVRRVERGERRRRVQEALALVRLTGFEQRRPSQLSGGQRQRVALARALVNRPAVLLLDEPLGALDLKLRREMQIELKRIQRDVGITFVYVTHDQEEAMSMSDQVAVMRDGQIAQVGTPSDVYERPADAFVAGFVGISNLVRGTVQGRDGAGYRVEAPGFERLTILGTNVLDAGQSVLLAVRPEKVTIQPGDAPMPAGLNGACGRVIDVSFAGAFTRYGVAVGDLELEVVDQNVGLGPRTSRGEEVLLSWHVEHTLVLPDTGAEKEEAEVTE